MPENMKPENIKLETINALPSKSATAVVGAHFQHLNGIPTFYCLRVAMKDTADTMLVKVPVDIGKAKYKTVNEHLMRATVAIAVIFADLKITKYTFKDKIVYSGKASDFEIVSY